MIQILKAQEAHFPIQRPSALTYYLALHLNLHLSISGHLELEATHQ